MKYVVSKKCPRCMYNLISGHSYYILFGGNGDDKLPQSEADSIDVRAIDEQLSINVTSNRSKVELSKLNGE